MTPVAATSFADFVLAIHISAVVIGFGVTFAYPIIFAVGRRLDPRHLGWFHRIQRELDRRLTNPSLLVIVIAGIYLASHENAWKHFFVQWGITVAIVLGALLGAFFIPKEKHLAELAERDVAAAPAEGPVQMSAEYEALAKRVGTIGALASVLVLATIVIMTVRP